MNELLGDALKRLFRYCARLPLALRRLLLSLNGQIIYRAKHAAPGAPRLLPLSPMQFMGRLSALVPPPRSHLLRFPEVFGPHSKHRARIVPKAELTGPPDPAAQERLRNHRLDQSNDADTKRIPDALG